MKMKGIILWFIGALFLYGCATAGRESFTQGQELEKNRRLEDARAMYEEALAKEPGNPEYTEALRKIQGLLAKQYMEKAKAFLAQQPAAFSQLKNALRDRTWQSMLLCASPIFLALNSGRLGCCIRC